MQFVEVNCDISNSVWLAGIGDFVQFELVRYGGYLTWYLSIIYIYCELTTTSVSRLNYDTDVNNSILEVYHTGDIWPKLLFCFGSKSDIQRDN